MIGSIELSCWLLFGMCGSGCDVEPRNALDKISFGGIETSFKLELMRERYKQKKSALIISN